MTPFRGNSLAEEAQPLTADLGHEDTRNSIDSFSSASTTSLVLERLADTSHDKVSYKLPLQGGSTRDDGGHRYGDRDPRNLTLEDGIYPELNTSKPVSKRVRRLIWLVGAGLTAAWVLALLIFVARQTFRHSSSIPHDPAATVSRGSGKQLSLDLIMSGAFRPMQHGISWINGANNEDGLLLERGGANGKDYLVVEDVRSKSAQRDIETHKSKTLMKARVFAVGKTQVDPQDAWPSRSLEQVLIISDKTSNWRHSYTGRYWVFDVAEQKGQALDSVNPNGRIQLASWSPKSDAIVFTRDNNMFLRKLASPSVIQITKDGGSQIFYGVPDWVYEEEVFAGNKATWWAEDGKFIAFLRSNDTLVPEYPIQYFVSRPSRTTPTPGLENYPEVRQIKYPKAGAPNPIVALQFYDVDKDEVFSVKIDGDFSDEDRLITEVIWAGSTGKVIVRETNRESDVLRVVLIDVISRTGRVVRTVEVTALDGGWFEVSEETRYIPADPSNGRPHDGYIDTVIHDGYDHLGYFTPLDNAEPVHLTSGRWEVVKAPSAVDLAHNTVYFVSTMRSPIERQIYSVKLDGSELKSVTDTSIDGYYDVSFSKRSGYALLSYNGPNVPWQKVISTPSNPVSYTHAIEENPGIKALAAQHELPIQIYSTVTIDNFTLQVVERRPPHFDAKKRYPVIFYLYGGPNSQTVDKKWNIDYQAYMAANLGYIVVTVDGRGTGFMGRAARCIIRGNIGYYEANDQIETAKIWGAKAYVDESRMAIWGWSYGGFLTLKTLEVDGGKTFQYGMAVAPVTDWRFYDSIYTERYMHTPTHNPTGYNNATINDVRSLSQNTRFLIMHGVADDNVHMQNTLTLLDKLDLAGVENYDMHMFPDSDHSIFFHNANRMVYDRLRDWLVMAFNGEWKRLEHTQPIPKLA